MDALLPGDPERVGGYTLIGRVGDGPRGTVYLGRESEEAEPYAIKLLAAPDDDQDRPAGFLAAKRVSSSYVARVVDAGRHEGRPYLVREHVEGRSLAETVAADGPLSGDALERVAVGMLTALTPIHLAGLVHHGLTPHNVIITADGPRLTDVAIGEPVGEVGYRSPEQLALKQYGPHSDLFSWAATVVFAATSRAPFRHELEAVLHEEPDLSDLPESLRRIVGECLAKDVAQRPTTYVALMRVLGNDGGEQPLVPPQSAAPQQPFVPPAAPVLPGQIVPQQGVPQIHGQDEPQGQPPLPAGTDATLQVPLEGVPVPPPQQTWGPPSIAAQQQEQAPPQHPQQVWTQQAAPTRRSFPIGLVAAMAAVLLISALGLFGATQYAGSQTLRPAAAEGSPKAQQQAQDNGAGQGAPQDSSAPQPEVTVPWAQTSAPDDAAVMPFELPSDQATSPTTVPELTSVPTPAPVPSQNVPTVQPTVQQPTQQPTKPTTRPTQKKTDKQAEPTRTPTERPTEKPAQKPSEKPTQKPTPEPEPTPTPTQKPTTAKPTPQPTKPSPKPTTAKPTPTKPSPKPTSKPPEKPNPYTPGQVCGGGFSVVRQSAFSGGVTYLLYNNSSGVNCAVTMKTAGVGSRTPVSVSLQIQNGGSGSDSGSFEYYAGPVKLQGKGKCAKYSGSAGSGSTSVDWGNCG